MTISGISENPTLWLGRWVNTCMKSTLLETDGGNCILYNESTLSTTKFL